MRKKLHPIVVVVAILQIVFGVLGLGCGGYAGVSGVYVMTNAQYNPKKTPSVYEEKLAGSDSSGLPLDQNDLQVEWIRRVPSYGLAESLIALASLFLALLMIASGVGLFFMQSWARWLAVGYAVLSMLETLLVVVYFAAVVFPALFALNDELGEQGDPYLAALGAGMVSWNIAYTLFYVGLVIYPLAVLILMLIPPVHRAFRGEPVSAGHAHREPDREDYRDRDDYGERFDYRDLDPGR
jgi:hypothetical protein